jgi:hypothetical protein
MQESDVRMCRSRNHSMRIFFCRREYVYRETKPGRGKTEKASLKDPLFAVLPKNICPGKCRKNDDMVFIAIRTPVYVCSPD